MSKYWPSSEKEIIEYRKWWNSLSEDVKYIVNCSLTDKQKKEFLLDPLSFEKIENLTIDDLLTIDKIPEAKDLIKKHSKKSKKPRKNPRKPAWFYYTKEEWAVARDAVFLRDGRICYRCQCEATQVDHVLPKSKYPHLALDLANLKPICWPCNGKKNTKVLTD
jgi:hypothetical protein